jgi:hypothetical protein
VNDYPHPIRLFGIKPGRALVELHTRFALRHDRPARWLQRLCFAVLRRLGAFAQEVEHTVAFRLDEPDLVRRIDAQVLYVYRKTGRAPTRVVIGYDSWEELRARPDFWSYASLDERMPSKVRIRDRFGDIDFMGCSVELVPWLSGALVLP